MDQKLINPPKYEWTAATALEADTFLGAAQDLINAHLKTLAADHHFRAGTRRGTPLKLKISLDLGPAVDAINEARQLDEQPAPGDTTATDS